MNCNVFIKKINDIRLKGNLALLRAEQNFFLEFCLFFFNSLHDCQYIHLIVYLFIKLTCAPKVTANNHATFTIQMYVNYSTDLHLLLGHPVCTNHEETNTVYRENFSVTVARFHFTRSKLRSARIREMT